MIYWWCWLCVHIIPVQRTVLLKTLCTQPGCRIKLTRHFLNWCGRLPSRWIARNVLGFAKLLPGTHTHLYPLDSNQEATAPFDVMEFTLSLRSYLSSPKACCDAWCLWRVRACQGKGMELALRIVKQTCHLHLLFVEPSQGWPRAQLYSFTKGVEAKQEDHG